MYVGQQVPLIVGSHDRCTGVHWTQMNRALRPMVMFVEMRRNQTIDFIQPFVKRSRVSAKLVLDQIAAMRENVPAILTAGMNLGKFWRGKSQICSPYP
jgi:hypothetical protein